MPRMKLKNPTFDQLIQLFCLRQEIELNRTQLSADTPGDIAETLKGNIQRCMAERDRLMLYITAIPDSLTRQAFMLRFAEGLTWAQTAASIGGGNTESAIMGRAKRYAKQNPLE